VILGNAPVLQRDKQQRFAELRGRKPATSATTWAPPGGKPAAGHASAPPAHGHQQQAAGQQNRQASSSALNAATTARTAARRYTTTSARPSATSGLIFSRRAAAYRQPGKAEQQQSGHQCGSRSKKRPALGWPDSVRFYSLLKVSYTASNTATTATAALKKPIR